jgi:hypothetical protein
MIADKTVANKEVIDLIKKPNNRSMVDEKAVSAITGEYSDISVISDTYNDLSTAYGIIITLLITIVSVIWIYCIVSEII